MKKLLFFIVISHFVFLSCGPGKPIIDECEDKDGCVRITSISINVTSVSVPVSGSYPLSATILPDNATYKQVVWTSQNSGIALVNGSGVVQGVSPGSTMVIATAKNNMQALCSVTVKQ